VVNLPFWNRKPKAADPIPQILTKLDQTLTDLKEGVTTIGGKFDALADAITEGPDETGNSGPNVLERGETRSDAGKSPGFPKNKIEEAMQQAVIDGDPERARNLLDADQAYRDFIRRERKSKYMRDPRNNPMRDHRPKYPREGDEPNNGSELAIPGLDQKAFDPEQWFSFIQKNKFWIKLTGLDKRFGFDLDQALPMIEQLKNNPAAMAKLTELMAPKVGEILQQALSNVKMVLGGRGPAINPLSTSGGPAAPAQGAAPVGLIMGPGGRLIDPMRPYGPTGEQQPQ